MPDFPAVLIGGPPHSGKSVFVYSLTRALRAARIPHYALRAGRQRAGTDW
jgi:CRISPR-associated protein Csx3